MGSRNQREGLDTASAAVMTGLYKARKTSTEKFQNIRLRGATRCL